MQAVIASGDFMKVVTVAAPKGGSGKTTLVSALAARAALESARVAMFDLNSDQANLTQWYILRGEPPNPVLVEVEKISRDTEVLRNEKFEWLLIDTPPLDLDVIEAAVAVADAVIIPVRASIFDIGAITCVVEMCKERRKPYAFVLSAVDNKMPKLTERAKAALVSDGLVLTGCLSYRQDYISALTAGKVGFEAKKELKAEIDQIWGDVKKLAARPLPIREAKERAAND
jgi:chromosome partitioning protein